MNIKEIIDAERWEAGDHGLAPMPSVEHNSSLDRIEAAVTAYVAVRDPKRITPPYNAEREADKCTGQTCKECAYFRAHKRGFNEKTGEPFTMDQGDCRIKHPESSEGFARFPVVMDKWWCGEFKSKDGES